MPEVNRVTMGNSWTPPNWKKAYKEIMQKKFQRKIPQSGKKNKLIF